MPPIFQGAPDIRSDRFYRAFSTIKVSGNLIILARAVRATVCEAAFPKYELRTEDLIAEGNLVALRGTFTGTQTGSFFAVAPTGRTVSVSLLILYRVEGKKIVQSWMEMNSSALMDQLSAQASPVKT